MKLSWKKLFFYTLLVAVVLWIIFPIYWTFMTSIRSRIEIFGSPSLFSGIITPQWDNYISTIIKGPYLSYLFNSLLIAGGNTLLVLFLGLPAAYAFSRWELYGAKHLFFWILTNRMAPAAVFILPLFHISRFFHLQGTLLILILTYCLFNLPICVWLLKGVIDGLPKDLDEMAMIEGANTPTILRKIIIPLAKPGIAVAALLVFLYAWNHYIFTITLASAQTRTITTGIAKFFTIVGFKWGDMAAVTIIAMIPGLILAFIVQRHIVAGLTFGAVKG